LLVAVHCLLPCIACCRALLVAVHCLLPCIACCSVLMLTLTLTILVGHPKIESYQTDSNTRHGYYHRDSAVCGQRAPSYQ
jgi:hypothetical protein